MLANWREDSWLQIRDTWLQARNRFATRASVLPATWQLSSSSSSSSPTGAAAAARCTRNCRSLSTSSSLTCTTSCRGVASTCFAKNSSAASNCVSSDTGTPTNRAKVPASAVSSSPLTRSPTYVNYLNRWATDHPSEIRWLMGGLLHLIQRVGACADCGPVQSPPRCTKCNSPPINGRCINFILFNVTL